LADTSFTAARDLVTRFAEHSVQPRPAAWGDAYLASVVGSSRASVDEDAAWEQSHVDVAETEFNAAGVARSQVDVAGSRVEVSGVARSHAGNGPDYGIEARPSPRKKVQRAPKRFVSVRDPASQSPASASTHSPRTWTRLRRRETIAWDEAPRDTTPGSTAARAAAWERGLRGSRPSPKHVKKTVTRRRIPHKDIWRSSVGPGPSDVRPTGTTAVLLPPSPSTSTIRSRVFHPSPPPLRTQDLQREPLSPLPSAATRWAERTLDAEDATRILDALDTVRRGVSLPQRPFPTPPPPRRPGYARVLESVHPFPAAEAIRAFAKSTAEENDDEDDAFDVLDRTTTRILAKSHSPAAARAMRGVVAALDSDANDDRM